MRVFSIYLSKKASKQFSSLPPAIQKQIAAVIDSCENDPFSLDVKKLKTPFEGYRIRSGNYRLLLIVEKKDVTVYSIQHRKDAYKK
ncbi:MAG: mRNA-degrading endonuclease RelE of RelBE toxin-antitoxin system [Candidatus Azotimanducaceae bacterium]|jgi:mRNA-degrading endonuclease RelE of RelBE toxin-antitoxin system